MKEDPYFMRELEELAIKAQSSFPISTSSAMKENRDRLQKMYRDFSSSYRALAKEIMDDIRTLEKVLQSAAHGSDESLYASNLLQGLKACFNRCSMKEATKAVKNCHQLAEVQKVISIIIIPRIYSL